MCRPKGSHLSEEHKRKIGLKHKGKTIPEEMRKRISNSLKGRRQPPRTEEHRKHLSESLTGKHLSEETKNKLRLYFTDRPNIKNKTTRKLRGAENPMWKGGISPINNLIRRCPKYKEWENNVLTRDNFTCQKCKILFKRYKLVGHHIKNFAQYPELRFSIDNGITLCKKHHKEFHKIYKKINNTGDQINEYICEMK